MATSKGTRDGMRKSTKRTTRTPVPSKAARSEQRNERILKVAGDMFLRNGYDGTSMDAVAEAAKVSKRALYAGHADKAALFSAVLRQLIDHWLLPIDRFQSMPGSLKEVLTELARYLATFALTNRSISTHRIIISEAKRRPEFGRLANARGRKPALRLIASILRRYQAELRVTDFETAADQFMSLAIDRSLRMASLGIRQPAREIEKTVTTGVDLFLHGASRCAAPATRK
jgi:AcrR family transcriptional regulator